MRGWKSLSFDLFILFFTLFLKSASLHRGQDRGQKEGGDSNPWHAVTCCISHLIFHMQPVDILKGKAEWKRHQISTQCAGQCPSSPAKHRCCVPIWILFLCTFSIYCSCSYKVRTVASSMHTIGPYYFVMMTLCLELWPACSNIPRSPLQSVRVFSGIEDCGWEKEPEKYAGFHTAKRDQTPQDILVFLLHLIYYELGQTKSY